MGFLKDFFWNTDEENTEPSNPSTSTSGENAKNKNAGISQGLHNFFFYQNAPEQTSSDTNSSSDSSHPSDTPVEESNNSDTTDFGEIIMSFLSKPTPNFTYKICELGLIIIRHPSIGNDDKIAWSDMLTTTPDGNGGHSVPPLVSIGVYTTEDPLTLKKVKKMCNGVSKQFRACLIGAHYIQCIISQNYSTDIKDQIWQKFKQNIDNEEYLSTAKLEKMAKKMKKDKEKEDENIINDCYNLVLSMSNHELQKQCFTILNDSSRSAKRKKEIIDLFKNQDSRPPVVPRVAVDYSSLGVSTGTVPEPADPTIHTMHDTPPAGSGGTSEDGR